MFKDRFEAGRLLAEKLQKYKNQEGIILAVPRGGLPVGYAVAKTLGLPMEIVLSKKIGHPQQKEYAIGSVSLETVIINEDIPVSEEYLENEIWRIRELLKERYDLYHQGKSPLSFAEKIVIIVDDGIATGNTVMSAIDLIRKQQPKKVVVAVPVASPRAVNMLEAYPGIDELICLAAPEGFYAVGQYYQDFPQISDEEVIELLGKANSVKPGAKLR